MQDEVEQAGLMDEVSRPRRSSRRRRKEDKRAGLLQSPRLDRAIGIVMSLTALAYLVVGASSYWADTTGYGGAYVGATPQEILYFVGRPDRVRKNAAEEWSPSPQPTQFPQWLYDRQPVVQRIDFEPDRMRLISISCAVAAGPGLSACPRTLGVGVGDSELQLLERLGMPNEEQLHEGRKLMRYNALGYEFVLENLGVRSIRHASFSSDVPGQIIQFLRWILP
jgi:hypothetical protein